MSAAWNPSQPEFVTIIFESGAVEVLKVTDGVEVVATNDFGACCVAWSPKGKQMVIGRVSRDSIFFYKEQNSSQYSQIPL